MDCGRDRAVRQPEPSHVRPLAHSQRCRCIKTPGRQRCTALRLPLRSAHFRPKPVACFPPAWLLPGIICRPSSALRRPTSNILPFGYPDPSSDSCTRFARNPGIQRRRGGDLPGPLSGTSTSLSVDRACLMQPRDSVASRNCAVRHWDHYKATFERCQRIPRTILQQEIHTRNTPLCITDQPLPSGLPGALTTLTQPPKAQKARPLQAELFGAHSHCATECPNGGRIPRRHE